MNKNTVTLIVSIVAITLLLLVVVDEDYSSRFYAMLRIAVCITAIMQAAKSFEQKNWILWGNCFVAILFNPVLIIHLERNIWVPIDIGVAVFFIAAMYHIVNKSNQANRTAEANTNKRKFAVFKEETFKICKSRSFKYTAFAILFAIVLGGTGYGWMKWSNSNAFKQAVPIFSRAELQKSKFDAGNFIFKDGKSQEQIRLLDQVETEFAAAKRFYENKQYADAGKYFQQVLDNYDRIAAIETNYAKCVEAGLESLKAGNGDIALSSAKNAMKYKISKTVEQLIADSENMINYQQLIADGNQLLNAEKWNEAKAIFEKAIAIPGYKFEYKASAGLEAAKTGIAKRQAQIEFERCMVDAKKLLGQRKDKEMTLEQAYEYCSNALVILINLSNSVHMSYMTNSSKNAIEELINLIERDSEPMKREIYLSKINNNKISLKDIPDKIKDYRICFAAVTKNGLAIQFVPDELIKADTKLMIYWAAVRQNGIALQYVSEKSKIYGICLAAVRQNGIALQYVPKTNRNRDICLVAVRQNGLALQFVGGWEKDHDMCIEAVKQNGLALQFVPAVKEYHDICHTAVKQNGLALQFAGSKDRNMCFEAVNQNRNAIDYSGEHYYDVIETLKLGKWDEKRKALRDDR